MQVYAYIPFVNVEANNFTQETNYTNSVFVLLCTTCAKKRLQIPSKDCLYITLDD